MKINTVMAVVLIGIGAVVLGKGEVDFKTKEKVIEVRPVQVEMQKTHHMALPPVVGGVTLVAGISLLIVSIRKQKTPPGNEDT